MHARMTQIRTCFSKAVRLAPSAKYSLGSSVGTGPGFLRDFRFPNFTFDNSDTRCSVIAAVVSATFDRSRPLITAGSAGEAVAEGRLIKRLFSFSKLREASRSLLLALSRVFFGGEKYGLWTIRGSGVLSELVFVAVVVGDLLGPVACRLRL